MFKYIFTFATQLGFYFALFSKKPPPFYPNTQVLPPGDVKYRNPRGYLYVQNHQPASTNLNMGLTKILSFTMTHGADIDDETIQHSAAY